MKTTAVCLILAVLAGARVAPAAHHPAPVEGDFAIKDFHFAAGETLPELRHAGSARRQLSGVEIWPWQEALRELFHR